MGQSSLVFLSLPPHFPGTSFWPPISGNGPHHGIWHPGQAVSIPELSRSPLHSPGQRASVSTCPYTEEVVPWQLGGHPTAVIWVFSHGKWRLTPLLPERMGHFHFADSLACSSAIYRTGALCQSMRCLQLLESRTECWSRSGPSNPWTLGLLCPPQPDIGAGLQELKEGSATWVWDTGAYRTSQDQGMGARLCRGELPSRSCLRTQWEHHDVSGLAAGNLHV